MGKKTGRGSFLSRSLSGVLGLPNRFPFPYNYIDGWVEVAWISQRCSRSFFLSAMEVWEREGKDHLITVNLVEVTYDLFGVRVWGWADLSRSSWWCVIPPKESTHIHLRKCTSLMSRHSDETFLENLFMLLSKRVWYQPQKRQLEWRSSLDDLWEAEKIVGNHWHCEVPTNLSTFFFKKSSQQYEAWGHFGG